MSDTENGEEINLVYAIKIDVFLKNGGVKEYHAQIPSDKIKDTNWLKKATNCMAMDPIITGKGKNFKL